MQAMPATTYRVVVPYNAAPREAFVTFLLVTATLFLRPAELFAELDGVPIYEFLILATTLFAAPRLQSVISPNHLKAQPIVGCTLGVLAAIVLSHATNVYFGGIIESGVEFVKTLVYFFLLIAVVDTPARMRTFLMVVAICAVTMVGICVVDYYGIVDFQFVTHVQDRDGVAVTGEDVMVSRMRGTGIFQDPNDISMVIVCVGVICSYFVMERGGFKPAKLLWIGAILLLIVALLSTRSRGGLLSAGAAGITLFYFRYGWKRTALIGGLGLAAVGAIAGRQADFDMEDGTGHDRLLLWRDGFQEIKGPKIVFGIGSDMYADAVGLVAHNSFVHTFVELGLFGGTMFFGIFALAALQMYRIRDRKTSIHSDLLLDMQPYIAAILAGWCMGMMSLSRAYVVPTYLIAGTSAAYFNLIARRTFPVRSLLAWNSQLIATLAAAGLGCLTFLYVLVKVLAR